MTQSIGPGAIPQLRKTLAHWQKEISDTQILIARGGPHKSSQRRYIAECERFIRSINHEIHELKNMT